MSFEGYEEVAEEAEAGSPNHGSHGGKGGGKGRPQVPGGTVFVFHLPTSWDDAELQRHFHHCGNVIQCRIQKKPTGESRGFGFVSYDSPEGARRAVVGLSGFPAGGKFITVNVKQGEEQYSLPIPAYPAAGRLDAPVLQDGTSAPPGATLFIFHLPNSWDENMLHQHFIHFGTILNVSVMRRPTQESKGFGFVSFADPASAERAVDGFHGFSAGDGKFLKVQIKRGGPEEQGDYAAAGAGAGGFVATRPAVQAHSNGQTSAYQSAYDAAVKSVQRLLTISFAGGKAETSFAAESFVADIAGTQWRGGGRAGLAALGGFSAPPAAVRPAVAQASQASGAPGSNLYIFHLPNTWTEVELEQCFAPFGTVVSTAVQRHADGSSRGFGFVGFDSAESATAAIAGVNGLKTDGKTLTVQYANSKQRAAPY